MQSDKRLQTELEKLLIARYKDMRWCRDYKTYLYISKKDTITYDRLVEELTPIAIKNVQEIERQEELYRKDQEEERNVILENRITPNRLLVIQDIEEIECDEDYGVMANFEPNLLKKALDELNVEIIKRIVRNTYPHKFS